MDAQRHNQRRCQQPGTVFTSSAIPNDNLPTGRVDIYGPQSQHLHQPQPAAEQQFSDQPQAFIEERNQLLDLLSCQHSWQPLRLRLPFHVLRPRPNNRPRQVQFQHLLVKKQQHRKRMVLRRSKNITPYRLIRTVGFYLRRTQFARVPFLVENNRPSYPLNVSFLGRTAHVYPKNTVAHLVEQARRGGANNVQFVLSFTVRESITGSSKTTIYESVYRNISQEFPNASAHHWWMLTMFCLVSVMGKPEDLQVSI